MSKFDRSDEARQWRRLYKKARWIKGRLHHLRHNPLCVFCLEQNIATPAELVDHLIPHKGDEKLFFDQSNWQSLCWQCHSGIKQKIELREELPEIGLDGWPIEDKEKGA